MSVFFSYPTDLQPQSGKGAILATAFSAGEQHILAAATKNGDITMYLEEGEHLDPPVTLHRSGECAQLQWHPRVNLLASGWDDGCVALWSERERVLREESSAHKAPITLLTFSPEGSRLITGDAAGVMVVWSVDGRGRLSQQCRYEKKGALTHLVFRAPLVSVPPPDGSAQPCPSFFFGGEAGMVVFADDLGHHSDVIKTGAPLASLHYNQAKDYLVLVTQDVVLYKYRISAEGKMTQERKVKLSIKGDGSDLQAAFAGAGLLAAANHENLVRLWHLEKEDNYVLPLTDPRHQAIPKDVITCLAFNPASRTLCAGTLAGRVVFWRFVGRPESNKDPSADDWEVLPPVETNYGGSGSGLGVQSVKWGSGEGLLAVASKEGVSVLNQTTLHTKYLAKSGLALVQLSSDSFCLSTSEGRMLRVQTSIRIKGFDLSDKYVLIWNGKKAEVRELPELTANGGFVSNDLRVVSQFATKASLCVLSGDNVYACVGSRIELLSLQGVLKSALAFGESEGVPTYLSASGQWMVCVTSHNLLKLWDISRREPKTIVPGRLFDEPELRGLQLKSARINASGTKVSILARLVDEEAGSMQAPDSRLHIYDVELDRVFSHDFGPRYYPTRHEWDDTESKLLAVETHKFAVQPAEEKAPAAGAESKDKSLREQREKEEQGLEEDNGGSAGEGGSGVGSLVDSLASSEVTTLFATSDHGVLMQDSFATEGGSGGSEALMALSVPHVLFVARPGDDEYESAAASGVGALPHLKRRVMRDFTGLEDVGPDTRRDLLDFSYHLTVGNMDEAYRAVKKISSTSVWENMAHMAVKTRRLDIAEVCLGNMGNARGARAVREAKKEPQKEAAVAMLAIQLGLLDDAERLYKECARYDLLVQLYMASGRWKDALRVCARYSRIQLKSLHYQYARHLEHMGDTVGAIKNYEKSDTHRHEVPRMLFDAQHIAELEAYIKASDDPALIRWWAQYCESNGSYDEAIKYYEAAKETLALVRVLCFRGADERAARICHESGDLAACYHLARQYEQSERVGDAIAMYKLARRFNHGIRLAKEHGMDNELLTLALECSSRELKVDAARYFESKGDLDRAVLLYQKGGRVSRALDLCFQGQLFDALRSLSDELGPETDPALLSRCADFFFQHGQFDKSVHLLIAARQPLKALTLCMKHGVKVTESMAEKMTPPKTKDEGERKAREDLLKKLAHVCKDQGEYHLACKKYTQSGDYVRAIKCLLKTSDTEKIVSYASMTKQKEIYILAANYLQNLDWHNDPEIMKRIIEFYSKAKAMHQLAVFYDACAQVEIDEYRDYEKALGALQDSQRFIIKGKDIPQREEKLASLETRIRIVQRFVDARRCVKANPDEMIQICNQLLDAGDVEAAIRVGDVYALLIEYFHSVGEYARAYQVIERMRAANIILSPYLDQAMVQRIHQEVGVQMQPEGGQWGGGGGGVDYGGDIGEEVVEEELAQE